MIRLGLSGRIIEQGGPTYQMSTTDFIAKAKEIGYEGVELRAGQLNAESTDDEVAAIVEALKSNSIACAFANFLAPQVTENLNAMRRMCEIANAVDTPFLRIGFSDIEWIQQACDIAAEYAVSAVIQIHTGSVMETIDGALRVCEQIGRDNFGLTFEPANFVMIDADFGESEISKLGDKLFNVTVQNLKKVDAIEGDGIFAYNGQGFTRCDPDDPEGVDFATAFASLKAVGYDGFATLIEPISAVMDNLELAAAYQRKLSALL